MSFHVNDGFLYAVSGIVILFAIIQSGFFLGKAVRRAKQLHISGDVIRKTILSSGLFSVVPAIAILVGVISLSQFLGLPLPWLRLSIIGAVTYELPAATVTAQTMSADMSRSLTDPRAFTAIAWVMTLGIISGPVLILFGLKKIQRGMIAITGKDQKWGEIVVNSLFLGMISAFVGMLFANIRTLWSGFIPIAVALSSAALMAVCGLLIKKFRWVWLEQYALSLCMLGAMALSIPIAAWLG
ncbi:MAG: DUF5058 family protein [Clostridia bacterium]|nr:DUF5058 family protein [Clostridia bacterium]